MKNNVLMPEVSGHGYHAVSISTADTIYYKLLGAGAAGGESSVEEMTSPEVDKSREVIPAEEAKTENTVEPFSSPVKQNFQEVAKRSNDLQDQIDRRVAEYYEKELRNLHNVKTDIVTEVTDEIPGADGSDHDYYDVWDVYALGSEEVLEEKIASLRGSIDRLSNKEKILQELKIKCGNRVLTAMEQQKTSRHCLNDQTLKWFVEQLDGSENTVFVIDNENIELWHPAPYIKAAQSHGIPVENVHVLDVNPLKNKKLVGLLEDKAGFDADKWQDVAFSVTTGAKNQFDGVEGAGAANVQSGKQESLVGKADDYRLAEALCQVAWSRVDTELMVKALSSCKAGYEFSAAQYVDKAFKGSVKVKNKREKE